MAIMAEKKRKGGSVATDIPAKKSKKESTTRPAPISMQAEAQRTTEKELEDEFAPASADEDVSVTPNDNDVGGEDHGAALLAGFDSDTEDLAQDTPFDSEKLGAVPNYKKTQKKLMKAKAQGSDRPGVVYVGRIPHGFYEQQMREYFSQFGDITKLRLSRNKRTGASKHFAFIEFKSDEVAKIVAETMDNYLMFGHILKCKYAPEESLHPEVWQGANKRYRRIPHAKLERDHLAEPKPEAYWQKKVDKEQKKREKLAAKMEKIGYELPQSTLTNPADVIEQRKIEQAGQENARQIEDGQSEPTGAIEPPEGVPKDDVALEAAAKKSKKSKKNQKAEAAPSAVEPLTEGNLEANNANAASTSQDAVTQPEAPLEEPTVKKAKKDKKAKGSKKVPSEPQSTGDIKHELKPIEVAEPTPASEAGPSVDDDAVSRDIGSTVDNLNGPTKGTADSELKKRKRSRKEKSESGAKVESAATTAAPAPVMTADIEKDDPAKVSKKEKKKKDKKDKTDKRDASVKTDEIDTKDKTDKKDEEDKKAKKLKKEKKEETDTKDKKDEMHAKETTDKDEKDKEAKKLKKEKKKAEKAEKDETVEKDKKAKKDKKRKSEGDGESELKSILKKSKKAA